ncbi:MULTISPECIES: ABC transporter permease [Streptomyces]|uniref:ABC transporter permease n=1 Tax=Streptomyces doudnae TaxID=3075536 RepID=A0ABD5ETZ2_9ACTN|nr:MULTISPECIES: ABC transporter permease [unclassified Streptomyces]MDT0438197.1 ABC transporter permease [Streptomyces sp. DSM 41981]SCE39423.1 peptide/nickel transport system permease protein [Streptomyces sp. SolWspMP-5a-2]
MTPTAATRRAPAPAAGTAHRITATALRIAGVVARRALLLVVLLAVVFAAVELLPGDAADAASERGESAADLAARRHLLGLDRPLWERFADWMTALPAGDLGTSAQGQKVTDLLADPLPNTLVLAASAFVITVVSSLLLGCWAASKPGGRGDRIVSHLSTAAFAVPEFVVSVSLLLVLSLWTGWLPAATVTGGDGRPATWTMLIMPVLALAVPQTGWNTRVVRGALADQASAPHVEAAHLDGLPPHVVLLRHQLPGAVPAVATGLATSTGLLFGGAVVVETLFNYPGVGSVLAGAVAARDTPLIAGVVMSAGAVISAVLLAADLVRHATLGARA